MTICAKYDGRRIIDCTRGVSGCVCARECIELVRKIAYPKRGNEEHITLQEFAEEAQRKFELGCFDGN